ncbi:GrsT [Paenibacillus mucilaginosus 3016]|uniref:GrsT n=2 Tax=Paenibacillus mucilaginosus TaxID=61624 RepID=H6NLE4_9BACL|nr:alpha/beta fold hydrolase [Paenibacillus mucilaginosus]AFC30326.1 GrsT [Paenibacillus mucilaginosus 3016]AFH62594.1 protein GrsT [Paenibacillus mucilaginosus K02]WFA18962.1 thioesterase [Paenibacillus mucilaginosus]
MSNDSKWLVRTPSVQRPVMRLFTLPYAGGSASIYREWAKNLPQSIEVVSIQLPGRESRLFETPYMTLEPMMERICEVIRPLLDVPYALFGHSMGALIAYETARRLQAEGLPPAHLFASAQSAPHRRKQAEELRHLLPDDLFIDKLRSLEYTPEEVLRNRELMELLLPMLRADFSVCDTYRFTPGELLRCPVSAFGGYGDKGISQASLEAWGECTEGSFTLRMVEGDHFFIHPQKDLLTAEIAAKLLPEAAVR